jgi:hypothetical protein
VAVQEKVVAELVEDKLIVIRLFEQLVWESGAAVTSNKGLTTIVKLTVLLLQVSEVATAE